MESRKIKYIDLGLPSGTLWADRNVEATNCWDYGKRRMFKTAQRCGTLPTNEQINELLRYTKHKVCRRNKVRGILFEGVNNNSIFMPFAGCRLKGRTREDAHYGFFWSCTIYSDFAYCFRINIYNECDFFIDCRSSGNSIRLVKNIYEIH